MALLADANRDSRGPALKGRVAITTAATVYVGSLLAFVTTSGRVRAATAATSRRVAGVCTGFYSSTSSSASGVGNTAGTQYAEFEYGNEWLFTIKTAIRTTACLAVNGFVADDDTIGGTAVGTALVQVPVGEIVERSGSTKAWVAVRRFHKNNIGI
jgi:hypothetical protein